MLETILVHDVCRMTSGQIKSAGIEKLKRAYIFALVIKSSLWEGIFVDDKV